MLFTDVEATADTISSSTVRKTQKIGIKEYV